VRLDIGAFASLAEVVKGGDGAKSALRERHVEHPEEHGGAERLAPFSASAGWEPISRILGFITKNFLHEVRYRTI
jgi:hypothetical protein